MMGYQVTVLEALDQPGGRARVFKRDGFTFDAGPTVITAPYLIEELFELAGRKLSDYVTLVPVDPFYRVLFDDGSRFDYVGDEERLLAMSMAIAALQLTPSGSSMWGTCSWRTGRSTECRTCCASCRP
jgi:phytoene dehydrogenase-like protein